MAEFDASRETEGEKNFRETVEETIGEPFPALKRLDEARKELYADLTVLYTEMSDPEVVTVKTDIDLDDLNKAFIRVVNDVYGSCSDASTTAEIISGLIKNEKYERITIIQGILEDEEVLKDNDQEEVQALVDRVIKNSDSVQDMADNLAYLYVSDFRDDISVYMQELIDRYAPTTSKSTHTTEGEIVYSTQTHDHDKDDGERTIEIKKGLSDHVIDVAKIAAGVGIALATEQLLRKFKAR